MARPRKEINAQLVEKLAVIHCTTDEIASIVGCNGSTIRRRFARIMEKGRAEGKMSLRRKQYEVALSGNATMLIWLGKQELSQRDKSEVRIEEIDAAIERELARVAAGSKDPVPSPPTPDS